MFIRLFASLLLLSNLVLAEATPPKIALVNMQKIFANYHRTINSQKRFNREYARIQKETSDHNEIVVALRFALGNINKEIEKNALDDEQKKKLLANKSILRERLKIATEAVSRFQHEEKQKLDNIKMSSMDGIMDEIANQVRLYAKNQDFDFVFDISGKNSSQVPFFLYFAHASDITTHILAILNKSTPPTP